MPNLHPLVFAAIGGLMLFSPLILAVVGTLLMIWIGVPEAVAALCTTLIVVCIAIPLIGVSITIRL